MQNMTWVEEKSLMTWQIWWSITRKIPWWKNQALLYSLRRWVFYLLGWDHYSQLTALKKLSLKLPIWPIVISVTHKWRDFPELFYCNENLKQWWVSGEKISFAFGGGGCWYKCWLDLSSEVLKPTPSPFVIIGQLNNSCHFSRMKGHEYIQITSDVLALVETQYTKAMTLSSYLVKVWEVLGWFHGSRPKFRHIWKSDMHGSLAVF